MAVKLGKIIGGGLGWAFGGPLGALLGVVLGSLVDTAGESERTLLGDGDEEGQRRMGAKDDFFMSLLVLSAAVMKADGRQLKSELSYIKTFLNGNFGEQKTLQALPTLKRLLETEINVRLVCLQIRQYVDHPGRLQLMHYLYGITASDGRVDREEELLLHQIGSYFNIHEPDLASIKAMYIKSANWAYEVLEIDATATDEEVKKAYRRMAARFHPDKVNTLGQDAVDAAHKKFQKVQEAYEELKKQRGLK